MHGAHLIKHYSRTQSTIALSLAEAELYATVAAASEALAMGTMCNEYGKKVVPSYLLESQIVVKDNIQEVLVDSGYWTADEVKG